MILHVPSNVIVQVRAIARHQRGARMDPNLTEEFSKIGRGPARKELFGRQRSDGLFKS